MNLITAEEVRKLMPETVEQKVAKLLEYIKEEAKKGRCYIYIRHYGLDTCLWIGVANTLFYVKRVNEPPNEAIIARDMLHELGFIISHNSEDVMISWPLLTKQIMNW